MRTQRVIYYSPVGYFKGGAERSLFDLLANPSILPILVVPEEGPISEKAMSLNIPCHIIPMGAIEEVHRPFSYRVGLAALKDLWVASQRLKRIAQKEQAYIVHSNGLKAHVINCFARRTGGAKAVLHLRDIPYTKPEIAVWHILRVLSDAFVMVSHACWPAETLPSKVEVIHNGTALVENTAVPKLNKKDPLTIGFIGRIQPEKGLHLLLDWVAAAREAGHNVNLSIRGAFLQDVPTYEDDIHKQVKELGLEGHVTFTGFIDDPSKVYEGIAITVVPSKTPDPLPRAVMESMARGIPVMGYPAGGIGEMIEDGKTGFLVDSSERFVQALETLKQDPEALHVMTEQAQTKIANEFTVKTLHRKLNDLYSQVRAKRSTARLKRYYHYLQEIVASR